MIAKATTKISIRYFNFNRGLLTWFLSLCFRLALLKIQEKKWWMVPMGQTQPQKKRPKIRVKNTGIRARRKNPIIF